jgi:lysozyme
VQLSPAGVGLAKEFEAVKLVPYDDADGKPLKLVSSVWRRPDGAKCLGFPTTGIGHLIRPFEADSLQRMLTLLEAEAIFRRDAGDSEAAVNRLVSSTINQHMFDACVLFTFNVGTGGFASSSLLKAINESRFADCTPLFLMWCKTRINGQLLESPGLKKRRAKEAALFATPMPVDEINVDEVLALVAATADQIVADQFASGRAAPEDNA